MANPGQARIFRGFLFNHRFSNGQIAALCTFLALLTAPTLGQNSQVLAPPSPCPTIFTYDPLGPVPGWWSGVVNLRTDYLLYSLWLDIVLDSQAIKLLHRTAEVTTQNFKNFRIEDEDMRLQPGTPTSLRFSVQYDTNDEVPRLQAIRLNGIVICNALLAKGPNDSTLKTNVNSKKKPFINPSKPSIDPVSPPSRPDPGNISNDGGNSSEILGQQTQCGTSTSVSKWPWVVALYRFDMTYGYYCGGSLISRRHVITAAKCVHKKKSGSSPLFDKSNMIVHLGKHDLTSVLGVQIKLVQTIIVSPNFRDDKSVYNGLDVALLVLNEPATYTDWVRPVCLWPVNQKDLDGIIGKKGWLVGWGFDENRKPIEQLNGLEIPVVKQETCFNSKGYVEYQIKKADNCFCAGDRKDTGLCQAVDTGNGFVFKMGNSWYLRGQNTFFTLREWNKKRTCDPTEYFQFADIAVAVSWINDIIRVSL